MTAAALTAAVRSADLDTIMVAGRYTLLEQPAAADVIPACAERGTGIVAASVFNSGLLAQSEPRRDGRYEYGALPEELWQRLTRIADICRAHGVPLPAAAIQYPLQSPVVTSVVVGGEPSGAAAPERAARRPRHPRGPLARARGRSSHPFLNRSPHARRNRPPAHR